MLSSLQERPKWTQGEKEGNITPEENIERKKSEKLAGSMSFKFKGLVINGSKFTLIYKEFRTFQAVDAK